MAITGARASCSGRSGVYLMAPGATGVGLASLLSFARVSTVNFGSFSQIGFGFALSPGVITHARVRPREMLLS
jgi:hypothetical protein